MKKIIFVLMLLFTCFLFGCTSSKIKYTNPETGEKVKIDIKPTEEPTEVYKVLYGLAYMDKSIKDFTNCSIVLDMNGTMDNNLEGENAFKLDIKSRTTLDEKEPKNAGRNDTVLDYIKKVSASLNTTVTGSALVGTENIKIDSNIKAYIGDGMIYIIPNLNSEVIDLFDMVDEQVPEMVKLINGKPLKLGMEYLFEMVPQEELRAINVPLTFENKSIKDILKDNHINDEMLKQIIDTIVKEYKVKITAVEKSLVTFSASANEYLNLEFTIDVNDMSISSLSFKQEINDESLGMKIKEEIIARFKYKANVETISDDDLTKAIDLAEIIDSIITIEDIINKAYSKEYDEPIEVINPGQPNFEVPEGGYDGSEVTIRFYHTLGAYQKESLNYYIEEFNKIYPNIHIEHTQVGGYDDLRNQISTEIMVGGQPNLAYCYEEHVAVYNSAGAVVHLDKLIDSEESDGNGGILGLTSSQKDGFLYGFLDAGRRFGDGLLYTLPLSKATDILYFNKDFFKENNLTVPNHWFSFDNNDTTSVEYVIKKIKEIDSDCFPLAIDSEQDLLFNLCSQMGTGYLSTDPNNHYLLNNPYTKAIMKILNDWYNKGYIITQSLYGSYVSSLFTNTDSSRPKAYMAISSSASATHMRPTKEDGKYPFEVGTSPYPQISYLYERVTYQGPSLCIFKKDNPQEVIASWLFAKFLTTDVNFQSELSMHSGYMPVMMEATYTQVYRDFFWNLADGYDHIMARAMQTALIDQYMYVTPVAYAGIREDQLAIKNMFLNVICYKKDDIDDFIELRFNQMINRAN